MAFYLLAFVVVLAIFGITRSPTARDKLHLQSIYTWCSKVILKQLGDYHRQILEILGLNQGNIDILEITDEDDEPIIEEIERSDSIEEIQGIRLRLTPSDYQIALEGEESGLNREELGQASDRRVPEERDKIHAAITASLRRLSTAASSGEMSGAQLYDILLQETLLHDKAMRKESLQASAALVEARAATVAAPSAPEEEALRRPVDEPSTQKVRMYFGPTPLQYTPHQK